MRTIKFRVFDKDYKKMHIVGKDGHDSLTCWDGKIQYYNLQNGEGSGEHGSYILMQYTGLTDKNGKEIYEGDIVASVSAYQKEYGHVEFVDGAFCLVITSSRTTSAGSKYFLSTCKELCKELEVIGNR